MKVLTASKIDEKCSIEMFVPDQCRMHPRTGRMIDGEIAHLRVSTEQVAFFLVNHKFLIENLKPG